MDKEHLLLKCSKYEGEWKECFRDVCVEVVKRIFVIICQIFKFYFKIENFLIKKIQLIII